MVRDKGAQGCKSRPICSQFGETAGYTALARKPQPDRQQKTAV
jgi:hypothetical protein